MVLCFQSSDKRLTLHKILATDAKIAMAYPIPTTNELQYKLFWKFIAV